MTARGPVTARTGTDTFGPSAWCIKCGWELSCTSAQEACMAAWKHRCVPGSAVPQEPQEEDW